MGSLIFDLFAIVHHSTLYVFSIQQRFYYSLLFYPETPPPPGEGGWPSGPPGQGAGGGGGPYGLKPWQTLGASGSFAEPGGQHLPLIVLLNFTSISKYFSAKLSGNGRGLLGMRRHALRR
jgi:hypothetical protein